MILDGLQLFGLCAVVIMVTSYALEDRHHLAILVFAGACTAAALYAYLIQSYPFMIAEAIWAVIAFRRWQKVEAARSM